MPKKSIPAIKKRDVSPAEYTKFITSLKAKIRSAQIKAAVTVNIELIKLYWEIGREIFKKQEKGGVAIYWTRRLRNFKMSSPVSRDFQGVTYLG